MEVVLYINQSNCGIILKVREVVLWVSLNVDETKISDDKLQKF